MAYCASMEFRTPLDAYLSANPDISQEQLAERVSRALGWTIGQTQISKWTTGAHLPRRGARIAIAKATRGAVSVESWDQWSSSTPKPGVASGKAVSAALEVGSRLGHLQREVEQAAFDGRIDEQESARIKTAVESLEASMQDLLAASGCERKAS